MAITVPCTNFTIICKSNFICRTSTQKTQKQLIYKQAFADISVIKPNNARLFTPAI